MAVASAASPSALGTYPTTTVPMVPPSQAGRASVRDGCWHRTQSGPPAGGCGRRRARCGPRRQAGPMPVLAPITRGIHVALRAAVLDFRETDHRRRPPPTVHVGLPARRPARFVHEAGTDVDAALATDVVGALLQRSRRELAALLGTTPPVPLVWLTRSGELAVHDADVLWSVATHASYTEAGLVPS